MTTYALIGSNGDVIQFDDIEYAVLRGGLSGLSAIPAEYDTSYTPGVIGAHVNTTKIVEREISLNVVVLGNGRAKLEERRRRLINALNPLNGECRLMWIMDSGEWRYIYARPQSSSPAFTSGTAPDAHTWECTVELVCHDPCWYATIPQVHEVVRTDLKFKLPFRVPFYLGVGSSDIPLVNRGTVPTPVLIVMHGRIGSPIVLKNTTTGETLTINRGIDEGAQLIIDTSPDNTSVQYIDAAGNISNALYYTTIGSRFWSLEPGQNTIHLDLSQVYNSASGTISYRERWLAL